MKDTTPRSASAARFGGLAIGLLLLAGFGCAPPASAPMAGSGEEARSAPPPLVIPSARTLEALGDRGLIAEEMNIYNTRNDMLLGADLPPAVAPVNVSQVYIRDQQWILNGRPWENYMQTTRSLQIRGQQ